MSAKANPVWDFFDRSQSDVSRAICKTCKASISLGSKLRKSQTTSALTRHLSRCHPLLYEKFHQKKDESPPISAAASFPPSSSTASGPPCLLQDSLEQSFARSRKWDDSDPRSTRIDLGIVDVYLFCLFHNTAQHILLS